MPTRRLLLLLSLAIPAAAQFTSGIQGIVTDRSSAAVPGAGVIVTNIATGVSRETVTNEEGLYRVLSLGGGMYRVQVRKDGFQSAERDGIALAANDLVRADFQIAVGAVSEKITVLERASLVETEQGRVTGHINQQQLKELPLNGRNLYSLVALQPGMTGRGTSATFGAGGGGTTNDSFAGENGPQAYASGQRSEANSFTMDDVSVNSAARGGITNLTPNADSVEEVRVVTNNFSAVDGRNSGAQIQVVSKSGTNSLHGGASYFFQNNTLSSRNLFEARVPVFRRNQFGYFVGGPIIKNRTFFFHSFEGVRQSGSRGQVFVVETPQFRDFVVRTRPNSIAAKLLRDFQPAAEASSNFRDLGSPAPGVNAIGPADGIADVGSAAFAPASTRDGNQYSVRIDHELRPGKDRLYGNFFRTTATNLAGGIRPVFNRPGDDLTTFGSLNHTHIFSPSMLNEFRAGVMRIVGRPAVPNRLDIPAVNVTGSTGFGIGGFPSGYGQTTFHYKNIFTAIRGAHTWKMGGELRRVWANSRNTSNFVPNYTHASLLDFADDEPLQMVRKVDPRTGEPAVNVVGLRGLEWALFLNDDWKVTRNLTINLGLRYENYGSPTEINNILRNLVPAQGSSYSERIAGAKVDVVRQFAPSDPRNFAPRFGFAWNPDGKGRMAVRGGYGLAYDRLFMTPLLDFRDNPPLRADATLGTQFGTRFTYGLGDVSKPFLGFPVDPALQLGLDPFNGIRGIRVSPRTVASDLKTSYTHNWFFGLQREAGNGLVVEANYLGSAGHRLYNSANVNRFRGDLVPDNRFNGLHPSFAAINMIESSSNSIHHGGTIAVRKAFSRRFSTQAAFTFGKTITDADDLVSATNYLDISNRRLDRALAGFDVPRKLALAGIYETPEWKDRPAVLRRGFGGWQISGFSILQAGNPLNVTNGAPWPRGDYNADGQNGDRPNAPADSVLRSGWTRQQFLGGIFRAADFASPAPGTNGNLGRNSFRGPGFAEVNLSLAKRFAITERVSTQFRVDAFNAFNRVNLGNPAGDMNNVNFGRVTGTATPRLFQFGLRFLF